MGAPRTPLAKRLEFRAAMLELGVIRQAAKQCGIPLGTAIGLNRELEADETYVQERSELHARVLPDTEAKLVALSQLIFERVSEKDLTPLEMAQLANKHRLKSFSYQNPKPQYLKALVDFYKAVSSNRRAAEPAPENGAGHTPVELTVHVHGPNGQVAVDGGS